MLPDGPTTLLPGMLRLQGAKSGTFKPLPLDRLSSLATSIDHHMQKSPFHPVMTWTSGDEGADRESITWADYGRGIHRAARIIANQLGYDLDKGERPPKDTYVAILASGDHQTYIATALGAIRAGCCAFPLSNNNSLAATVHLLQTKKCALLIRNGHGSVPHLEQLAKDALAEYPCKYLEWIGYERLYAPSTFDSFAPLPPLGEEAQDMSRPVLCFHSSGSTSFPKPITFSDHKLSLDIRAWHYQSFDMTDRIIFLGHLPCFHVMCFLYGCVGMFGTSSIYGTFEPVYPPPAPMAPAKTLRVAAKFASYLIGIPLFINIWSQDDESIELLKTFDLVGYGGGLLPRQVGNMLASRGVKLMSVYSATEIGARLSHDTLQADEDGTPLWNMNLDLSLVRRFFRPQNDSSGHYEYLIAASDRFYPNVFNDEYNGEPVFATNDLVVFHPGNPQLFEVVGRRDDQIVLSTGEKTNPTPLVGLVEKSPLVKSCLYFGRSKPHNGILVEAIQPVDVHDDAAVAQFRRSIWPFVEEANEFAPSHSRVLMEMIVVGHAAKPFERTAKGSLRSGIILKAYEDDIAAAYKAFDLSAEVAERVPLPSLWDANGTIKYTRLVISQILDAAVQDDQDFFIDFGADSLAATRIRNTISASLERSKDAGMHIASTRLDTDVVYQHPTINSLASEIVRLVKGEQPASKEETVVARLAAMEELYAKYNRNWPQLGARRAVQEHGKVVGLVTGTTGGLGSHTLEQMIRSNRFSTIWALNRGSSSQKRSLLSRQMDAFAERGLDVQLLKDSSVHLVEASLEETSLGLDVSTYDQLASSVDVIYHIAWRLDFNLSLHNFEQNIRGTRNLLGLALLSSASFYFTSSISVALNADTTSPVKEGPLPFSAAVGIGYGESKAVTERLLESVGRQCGLATCSVRIGQLSGSTTNGYWATSDWVPIMIKSGAAMGSLPKRNEQLTWLPTDTAAGALLDLGSSDSALGVRHIVQTNSTPWNSIMEAIASRLEVKTTSSQEWLTSLEKEAAASTIEGKAGVVERIPAIKLLPFFKSVLGSSSSLPALDCTHSLPESTSLRNAAPLSERDSNLWLSFWNSKRLLE